MRDIAGMISALGRIVEKESRRFASGITDNPMKQTASLIAILAFTLPVLRAEQPVPAGLSAGDWSGIRAAHENWRHRFEKAEDGSHIASNPGQNWTTRFDGRGFLVEPDGESWRWGLELRSYGVGEDRIALAEKAPVSVSKEKLRYAWDGRLEEWFRNDTRGMEQGWTISERPAGSQTEALRLDLAVRGGLKAQVNASGLGVSFADASGTALTYGGLKAWDATGRDLAVRFEEGEADGITITVDDFKAIYPITIDPIAQQTRLKADNAGDSDAFGWAVAISGNTAAVSARFEEGPGNSLLNSGAVYVFVRTGSTWTQQAYLRAPNADAHDLFGTSVALSGDILAVGAPGEDGSAESKSPLNNDVPGSGAVYTYARSGSTWTHQIRIKAPNAGESDTFGTSVALSNDFLFIGAPNESNSTSNLATDNDNATNAGAVYVYSADPLSWNLHSYLKASTTDTADLFGDTLAVSGNTLVVGATNDGNNGRCAVFTYDGTSWSEQAILVGSNTQPNDLFGTGLAISGDTIVVGAPSEDTGLNGMIMSANEEVGAAYVFVRNAGVWTEQAILKASNAGFGDEFGHSVAISGDLVAIGAINEDSDLSSVDNQLASNSGAVYLFRRSGTNWTQSAFLKGSLAQQDGRVGRSVALSGGYLIIGASGDDNFSGAAYPYLISEVAPTLTIKGAKTIRVDAATSRYLVRGSAADVEGDLVRVEAKDSRSTGKKTFRSAKGTSSWTYRAPLKEGRNKIQVVAVDAGGNRSPLQQITVIRK